MKHRIWKSHVIRPLLVVIFLVVLLLIVRAVSVPSDFGVNGQSFTYGWYREGNIDEWKAVTVKYRGREYCNSCHEAKVEHITASPHQNIQCENCHGPARQHPADPPKLPINLTREQCLRCHARLEYPSSGRANIKSIELHAHNVLAFECVDCHDPHSPRPDGEE
jgi:hypothetical protein